ncbi:hypothetical protein CcCBS67573_g00220 [Chytriomyces confervae]|uniref:Uncharacterized protein n=1 Tax=Chytriomyces confervae TaxID=246404 RepID=A0A507FSW1_9FUNG|nr:hypothetical protein CcCBS67573_g00220 [Chytriomyces confervae]
MDMDASEIAAADAALARQQMADIESMHLATVGPVEAREEDPNEADDNNDAASESKSENITDGRGEEDEETSLVLVERVDECLDKTVLDNATLLLRRVAAQIGAIQTEFSSGESMSERQAQTAFESATEQLDALSLDSQMFARGAAEQLAGLDDIARAFADIAASQQRISQNQDSAVVDDDADSACGIMPNTLASAPSDDSIDLHVMSPEHLMNTLARADAVCGLTSFTDLAAFDQDFDAESAHPEVADRHHQKLEELRVRNAEIQEKRQKDLESSQMKLDHLHDMKRQLTVLRDAATSGASASSNLTGSQRLEKIHALQREWEASRESEPVEESSPIVKSSQTQEVNQDAADTEKQISHSEEIMMRYKQTLAVQEDELSTLRSQLNALKDARAALDSKKNLLAQVLAAREAIDEGGDIGDDDAVARHQHVLSMFGKMNDPAEDDDTMRKALIFSGNAELDSLESRLGALRSAQDKLKMDRYSNSVSMPSKGTQNADNQGEFATDESTVSQLMNRLTLNSVPSKSTSRTQTEESGTLNPETIIAAFELQTDTALTPEERIYLAQNLARRDSELHARVKKIWDGDLSDYDDVEVQVEEGTGLSGQMDAGYGARHGRYSCESDGEDVPMQNQQEQQRSQPSDTHAPPGRYSCLSSTEASPLRIENALHTVGNEVDQFEDGVNEEQVDKAYLKIDDGIQQIVQHMEDLKGTHVDFTNAEHVKAYAELFASLSGQLEQFMSARAAMDDFKIALQKKMANSMPKNLQVEQHRQLAKFGDAHSVFSSSNRFQPSIARSTAQSDTESESELERTLDAKEPLSYSGRPGEAYSWVERAHVDQVAKEEEEEEEDDDDVADDVEDDRDEYEDEKMAEFMEKMESRRLKRADEIVQDRRKAGSDAAAASLRSPLVVKNDVSKSNRVQSVQSSKSKMDARTKKLYDGVKDSIYRGAANAISKFESEPFFLVSTFKSLQNLDSSYLRQKFLLNLEALMEERDQCISEAAVAHAEEATADDPKELGGVSLSDFVSDLEDEEAINEIGQKQQDAMDTLFSERGRPRQTRSRAGKVSRGYGGSAESPSKSVVSEDGATVEWNYSARIAHCVSNIIIDSRSPTARFSDTQILTLQNFLLGLIHAELDALGDEHPSKTFPIESVYTLMDETEQVLKTRLTRYIGLNVQRLRAALVDDSLDCVKEVLQDARLMVEKEWERVAKQEEEEAMRQRYLRGKSLKMLRDSSKRFSPNEATMKNVTGAGSGLRSSAKSASDQRVFAESMLHSFAKDETPIVIKREERSAEHSSDVSVSPASTIKARPLKSDRRVLSLYGRAQSGKAASLASKIANEVAGLRSGSAATLFENI